MMSDKSNSPFTSEAFLYGSAHLRIRRRRENGKKNGTGSSKASKLGSLLTARRIKVYSPRERERERERKRERERERKGERDRAFKIQMDRNELVDDESHSAVTERLIN